MAAVDAGELGAGKPAAPGWRGGFGRLWAAAVVSRFGDALRGAALPLLAVSLTDSPVLVSLVTACGFLPWLLFGLIGGAIADRVDQRRAMWAVDGVRAVLMAGFAVAVWLDRASIGLLLALAFALTTLQTLFDNAATALLPSVVGQRALGRANARLMTGQEVMGRFVGAPLVPVLLGLGAAMPYAADAVTYLAAAALVASLRAAPPERAPRPPGGSLRRDIAEGLAVLWRDRTLRALCASTTLCNIGIGALIATLVLHITGWLDAGNTGYAAVITVYGIGSVAGGLVAARLTEKLGRARALVVCGTAQIGALTALGAIRSLPVAVAAMGLFGFAGIVWNVTEVTMMQQRSPDGALGRVSSAFRTLSIAGTPLGALLGGVMAQAWGLNTPALGAAALFVCGVAALVPGMWSVIN
ncbi:MFS transporter [Streptomyces rapamycinicus]|uniref:Antibiotic transporter n=2 Tax=Streptomyces rapamycinicus TaxID=1226757 RepID=A0A0A0NV43_STRRN|nr:MFS transporter [Streptomyces rapamycinicus]AGP58730.1 antibiotic transporter [Streptomyces rapamycinicus NRRL 5491]MBB4786448.1 putative MFS family arabinose efflux permease [Streptomyces rapamycinicus]RLV78093.1 antibiotic transporter [Streptomyces rapamycinicus NRRL 5491]UTO66539.1 MFS transporter [Streptomyces rapamycinicus]UTP34493.1 MFS transporter [Streptomyces rapamycinicus NRRL 5491]